MPSEQIVKLQVNKFWLYLSLPFFYLGLDKIGRWIVGRGCELV